MKKATSFEAALASAPLEKVIEALQAAKCSWTVVRELLVAQDIRPGMGWDDLLARGQKKDSVGIGVDQAIRKLFNEHVVAGPRYVQIYDLDEDLAAIALNHFSAIEVPTSDFSSKYPVPLSKDELANAPSEKTLCEVRVTSSGDLQLIFCSSVSIEEKLLIDRATTPDIAAVFSTTLKGRYDYFMAYGCTHHQAFDILTFRPKLKRVEVALDLSEKGSRFDGPAKSLDVLSVACNLFPALQSLFQSAPTNLYPAISGIYSATKTNEVHLIDAGFRTPSGAVNRSKMPSSFIDVREETFHKGGANAVKNDVRPHGIVTSWKFAFPSGSAKIRLWATVRMASAPTPRLDGMELTDCLKDSDVVQAINKVVKFL